MMTMHNHVLVRASYPGDCPGCDVVWDAIRVSPIDRLLHYDDELQVARSLQSDYGDREMYHHLSALMQKGQSLKYRLDL